VSYSHEVEEAQNENDDPGCNDNTPHCEAERLLARRGLVEVPQDVDAKYNHGHRESYKAVSRTQQWPVASKVCAEEREL